MFALTFVFSICYYSFSWWGSITCISFRPCQTGSATDQIPAAFASPVTEEEYQTMSFLSSSLVKSTDPNLLQCYYRWKAAALPSSLAALTLPPLSPSSSDLPVLSTFKKMAETVYQSDGDAPLEVARKISRKVTWAMCWKILQTLACTLKLIRSHCKVSSRNDHTEIWNVSEVFWSC